MYLSTCLKQRGSVAVGVGMCSHSDTSTTHSANMAAAMMLIAVATMMSVMGAP
jgi:hypothetical protein